MTLFESVQLLALASIKKPDGNYFIRRICRWYSREFSTPLHEVEALPLDYVLQNYFESIYEELEEEDFDKRVAEVLESPEQKKMRKTEQELEEMEYEEFAQFTADQAKMEAQQKEKDGLANVPIQPQAAPFQLGQSRESALPKPSATPPSVRMEFVNPNLLEDEAEELGGLAPPPKKK